MSNDMSEERNCDERHKWKFDKFETLDSKGKKLKNRKFSLFTLY